MITATRLEEPKAEIVPRQARHAHASSRWVSAAAIPVALALVVVGLFLGIHGDHQRGNLNEVITVQVGSQVSGNIIALYADFNTKVKKGQLVAEIDPAPFKPRSIRLPRH